jgi:hypothetical protein
MSKVMKFKSSLVIPNLEVQKGCYGSITLESKKVQKKHRLSEGKARLEGKCPFQTGTGVAVSYTVHETEDSILAKSGSTWSAIGRIVVSEVGSSTQGPTDTTVLSH